jgi:hypothetical protein
MLLFVGIAKAETATGEEFGLGREANKNNAITAVNRFEGARAWLVLRENNADLLVVPDTPQGIVPKLDDAFIKDKQLAVVMDYDFCLMYQLYALVGGVWKKEYEMRFCNLDRLRDFLIAVRIPDLNHVKVFSTQPGNMEPRVRGVIKPYDHIDSFQFETNGTALKNGNPYSYNSGQDSN